MTVKHHEQTYKVGKYNVKELFNINNKHHYYDFIITKGKDTYSLTIENKVNKRKKIIKDIKSYKEEDIKCIVPIYKNDRELEIYCLTGKEQVSKEILKNNSNFKKIIKKAKKYKLTIPKTEEVKEDYKKITIYNKNIPDNYKILIWNYKGLIIIDNNSHTYKKFLDYDLYDNIVRTTTSRYFVLFENTSVNGIEKIHCYDLKKNKYKVIKLEKNKVSKDSYINGVVNDLIYITDRRNEKQFILNVKKEELKEIGNHDYPFTLYTNNNKEVLTYKEFLKEDHYFINERIKNKKITKSEDLVQEDNYYYFKEDNNIYKQLDNNNKILLLTLDNITEWNVYNKELVIKREDELYLYNDKNGLKKLIDYNELNYNDNPIYYLWK